MYFNETCLLYYIVCALKEKKRKYFKLLYFRSQLKTHVHFFMMNSLLIWYHNQSYELHLKRNLLRTQIKTHNSNTFKNRSIRLLNHHLEENENLMFFSIYIWKSILTNKWILLFFKNQKNANLSLHLRKFIFNSFRNFFLLM